MKIPISILIFLSLFILFKTGFIQINLSGRETPAETTYIAPSPSPKIGLDEGKLWSLIQEWRQSQGLKPYIKDQRLCSVAEQRLPEIRNEWSHDKFEKRFSNAQYWPYDYEIAENLAQGFDSEKNLLESWLSSSSHRKILNYSYTYSCIETSDGYAVQVFANF